MKVYFGVAAAMVLTALLAPVPSAQSAVAETIETRALTDTRLGRRAPQRNECFSRRRRRSFSQKVIKRTTPSAPGSALGAPGTGVAWAKVGLPSFEQYVGRGRFLDGAKRWLAEVGKKFTKKRAHLRWKFSGLHGAFQALMASAQRSTTRKSRFGSFGSSGRRRLSAQQQSAARKLAFRIGALLGLKSQGWGVSATPTRPKAGTKPPPPPLGEAAVAARRKELAGKPCFPMYVLESGGSEGSQLVEIGSTGNKRVVLTGIERPQGVVSDPRSGNLLIVEQPRRSSSHQPSQQGGRILEVDPVRGEVTSFQDSKSLRGLLWVDASGTLYGIGERGRLWLRPPGEAKFEPLNPGKISAVHRVGDYLYFWSGPPGNNQFFRLDPSNDRRDTLLTLRGTTKGLAVLKGALYLSRDGKIWKVEGLAPGERASMKIFASFPSNARATSILGCGEKLYALTRNMRGGGPAALWTVDEAGTVSQIPKVSLKSPAGVAFYRGGKRAVTDFAALVKKHGESGAASAWVKQMAGRTSQLDAEAKAKYQDIKTKLELIQKLRAIKAQLGAK